MAFVSVCANAGSAKAAKQVRTVVWTTIRSDIDLFQQIRDFGDAGLGAGVVHLLTRSGAADAAHDLAARLDRDAAAEREHIGHVALRRVGSLSRALLEFERRGAEHASRVGFAAGHFDLLRRSLF